MEGDFIGFHSIVDGHFVNSAVTMSDTFCCFLKIDEIQELIKSHKPFSEKVLDGF